MTFQKGHLNYLMNHTEKTKRKISESRKGENNPFWKGGKKELICNNCKETFKAYFKTYRISRKYCSRKCADSFFARRQEAKNRMIGKLGEKAPNWRGGIKPLALIIRSLEEYRQWFKKVFERDNFTCQKCFQRGGKLHSHHKNKSFSQLLKEFLQTYSQFSPIEDKETLGRLATTYKPFWDVDNGQILCKNCHKKTDDYLKHYGKFQIH